MYPHEAINKLTKGSCEKYVEKDHYLTKMSFMRFGPSLLIAWLVTQLKFTCSKSTMETPKQYVVFVQI